MNYRIPCTYSNPKPNPSSSPNPNPNPHTLETSLNYRLPGTYPTLTLTIDLIKWVPEHMIRKAEKQPSYSQEDTEPFRIDNIYRNGCEVRNKNRRNNLFKQNLEAQIWGA